jgi:hypothetical protein
MIEVEKKYKIYRQLYSDTKEILEEAKQLGQRLGITEKTRGTFALTPSHSSFPGPIASEISREMARPENVGRNLPDLVDDLRDLVKDYYGDGYDAAPVGSGEGALWLVFETLISSPMLGRGEGYRSRYLVPFERHISYHANFGRPFPPKYKYIAADRYVTSGELGVEGKRLLDVDAVLIPAVGARYEAHGIKYYPAPLLSEVQAEPTAEKFVEAAERQSSSVTGIASLAYDTPGYGYGEKTDDGSPKLQMLLGKLAQKYDIPYITDDAWGAPIIGTDFRKTGASLAIFSVDKVMRGPLSALIIGKEEELIPIRRALGIHSHRYGSPSAYSKAMYSAFDPGREQIIAQTYIIKTLIENPRWYTQAVDATHKIVMEEFSDWEPASLRDDVLVSKSYNNLAVEINYDRTWKNGERGIPIFTEEDSFAGTALIESALNAIGILPTITYDGNIMISPGHGTVDDSGELIEERMRLGVKALFGVIGIICKFAGIV